MIDVHHGIVNSDLVQHTCKGDVIPKNHYMLLGEFRRWKTQ
jgi:hypothetical protein